MASTALYLLPESRMLKRADWTKKELRLGLEACTRALKYRGDAKTDIHNDGDIAAVIRRLCTDRERKKVVEKWI